MPYRMAAMDVPKRRLAVVVSDVEGEGEDQLECRKFGASPGELQVLAPWRVPQQVEEVVMESTAPYWRPVWGRLERYGKPARQPREGAHATSGTLHLCPAKSHRGPRARKSDFVDGKRLIRRLVAPERILSFVPDEAQRLWRTVTRRKHPLTRAKIGFRNQLEARLEQAHLPWSSLVSDLLGVSARRICGRRWRKGNATPGCWRPWRSGDCGRRRNNCATRWGPVRPGKEWSAGYGSCRGKSGR